MKKLTKERLEKIASWSEVYGDGSNIMLPAGEAKELVRLALSAMDSESESQAEGAIGVFRVGKKSGQEPPVVLTEAVNNLPEGVYWLYATHQPTADQRREWMACGVDALKNIASEYTDTDCIMDRYGISYEDAELRANGAQALAGEIAAYADKIRSGEVDL